jgi:hypothetical protein
MTWMAWFIAPNRDGGDAEGSESVWPIKRVNRSWRVNCTCYQRLKTGISGR